MGAILSAGLADAEGLGALAVLGVRDVADTLGVAVGVAARLKAALAPFAPPAAAAP